jgi:hypothetical protein
MIIRSGSSSDHVRVMPQGLEIVGIITPDDQKRFAVFDTGPALLSLLRGVRGQRDVEGWQTLKALVKARKRLEITTRYDTYFVLPIELLADEDAGFGLALQFTMKFLQIETGSVRSIDQIAVDMQDSMGGTVGTDNLGRQQLGPEESVPLSKAKPRPTVINPWTAAAA